MSAFKAAFAKFDKDGSGHIDKNELRSVMDELGKEVTDKELDQMLAHADKDGNGVDFSEFVLMMGKQVAEDGGEESILAEAFKVFDRDGSGYIDRDEMQDIFKRLETNSFRTLTPSQVDDMLKEADTNGDGKISYEEFVKIMVSSQKL